MFDFTQKEKELLEKLGQTGQGRELAQLLKRIKNETDKASNIPDGADYAVEAKGRALFAKMLKKILDGMIKTPGKNFNDPDDLDSWD